MEILQIELPLDVRQRIDEALSARFGYDPGMGITKGEFTERVIYQWLREVTVQHEADVAAENARRNVLDNPEDGFAAPLPIPRTGRL